MTEKRQNLELSELLNAEILTIEDMATFIMVQHRMERADIKITDLCNINDAVEVQWSGGDREWLDLESACSLILDALERAEYIVVR